MQKYDLLWEIALSLNHILSLWTYARVSDNLPQHLSYQTLTNTNITTLIEKVDRLNKSGSELTEQVHNETKLIFRVSLINKNIE